eukprot:Gb_02138 [translate_table: standard]
MSCEVMWERRDGVGQFATGRAATLTWWPGGRERKAVGKDDRQKVMPAELHRLLVSSCHRYPANSTSEDGNPSSTKQSGPLIALVHCQSGVGSKAAAKDYFRLPNDDKLDERESFDSNFMKSFFSLMRKESTFSGQVQLLERILQIQDSTVLCW